MKRWYDKQQLDERQEQILLQIEHRGCWFAFWALLASIFIQSFLYGMGDLEHIAGEWLVFMALALYLMLSCTKHGIWDRKYAPTVKNNLILSISAAVVFAILFAVINYHTYQLIDGAVATAIFMFFLLFVLTFLALSLVSRLTYKRLNKLENTPDDAEK